MNKLFISFLTVLGLLVFMPISVAYAASFGAYAIRTGSEYNGCQYPGQYYYGSWAGTNGCKGGDWTLNFCVGSWCPTLNRTVMNDQPQYSYNFDDTVNATIQPRFPNGQNTPDGAVFDHWETRTIDDYQGTQPTQTGTSLPANITIYDPYHNGVWFYYRYPAPTPTPIPALSTPSCGSPTGTTLSPTSANLTWGGVANATGYNFRLDNLNFNQYDAIVQNNLSGTSYDVSGNLNWGTNYQYRVSARIGSTIGPWATCSFSTQSNPTLKSLSVGLGTGAVDAGPVGISGLRSEEGGLNYKNSLRVTVNAGNITSNPTNVRLIGAGFTNGAIQGNSLYQVTQKTYGGSGFTLLYALSDSSATYYNGNWPDPVKNFTGGRYYAYYYDRWSDIDGITNLGGMLITPLQFTNIGVPFNIQLNKSMGNKTWKTYGFLYGQDGNYSTVGGP